MLTPEMALDAIEKIVTEMSEWRTTPTNKCPENTLRGLEAIQSRVCDVQDDLTEAIGYLEEIGVGD
jgi:hypothetical protein